MSPISRYAPVHHVQASSQGAEHQAMPSSPQYARASLSFWYLSFQSKANTLTLNLQEPQYLRVIYEDPRNQQGPAGTAPGGRARPPPVRIRRHPQGDGRGHRRVQPPARDGEQRDQREPLSRHDAARHPCRGKRPQPPERSAGSFRRGLEFFSTGREVPPHHRVSLHRGELAVFPCKREPDRDGGDRVKKVVATGTFDILHPGHIYYLEQSRKLGDELYVIVARDANVTHKPKPVIPEEQRVHMIASLAVVDHAVLGDLHDMYRPIEEIRPDVITFGFNQHFNEEKIRSELEKRGLDVELVRIGNYSEDTYCSSSLIIRKVLERYGCGEE